MHQHYKIFKPYGYVSQFKIEPNRKSLKRLGELYDFPLGIMAVGRLDADSEGLLFLTTDGKLSNTINSEKVEKEYYVQVDGVITQEAIEQMKEGVAIAINGEKHQTKPCKAFIIEQTPVLPKRAKPIRDKRHGPTSWFSITLREGKFRQVRKMTAVVGFPTLRLVRIRIGDQTIKGMGAGDVVGLVRLVR